MRSLLPAARRAALAVSLAAAAPLAASSLHAQGAPPAPPASLTPEVRRAVVDSVAEQLTRFYAVADTGKLIADHLRRRLREGAYDALTNPVHFAEAVSADMKAINGDRHLSIAPRGPGSVVPPGMTRLPRMQMGGSPPTTYPPQMVEMARRTGFGLGRVEILPGNVGYFEINGFSQVAGPASEAITAALRYLAHTDAIIFDVRDHNGGSAYLSNFLISHFFGPDPVPSLDVEIRAADQLERRYTIAEVPGPRRPDVPVYVLTGRGTISAGEDFAFVMRNLGRATLVGEPTVGAGRNNPKFDAGHGFAASISVSRVMDPKTGAEWEGVGVQPHVVVPPRTALAVAHQAALTHLAERAGDGIRKRELEHAREFVAASTTPRSVPAATLQAYAGTYGGERLITLENGRLVYRRDARSIGRDLVALSETEFALGPYNRLAFERTADGYSLRISSPVAAPLTFRRTGPPATVASEH